MAQKIHTGKLIVFEGTDGSGKGTQARLLIQRLQKEGKKVVSYSFPQYGKKSAGLVEEYLNFRYGKPKEVSPYAASLFYALDRFDISREIKKSLEEGNIVILDRYVDSNAGHQGGKIKDKTLRRKFIKWLYEIEYGILGVPEPDLVLILHVPAKIGYKLVYKKQQRLYLAGGKTHDAHEADINHLKNAEASYLWLAENYPKNHKVIECAKAGKILTPEEIGEMVWLVIKPLIAGKSERRNKITLFYAPNRRI